MKKKSGKPQVVLLKIPMCFHFHGILYFSKHVLMQVLSNFKMTEGFKKKEDEVIRITAGKH